MKILQYITHRYAVNYIRLYTFFLTWFSVRQQFSTGIKIYNTFHNGYKNQTNREENITEKNFLPTKKLKRKIRDSAIYRYRDFYHLLKFDVILSMLYYINIFTLRSIYFTFKKNLNVLCIFLLLITFYTFIV